MSLLTVGELLLEADQQVRELTFDASPFYAGGLLAGWGGFLTAASAVAATLPVPQPRQDLEGLLGAWRWNPRQQVPADTRLATATIALQEVAALTGQRDLAGAPDLAQVAGHLCAIVCVGAHATGASIRSYLEQTSVAAQQGRATAQLDATSQVPRFVFTRLLGRVNRAEELTLIGLSQSGRYTRPGTPAAPTDQVEGVTARFAHVAGQALTADTPSIADLRTIARINAQLSTHTRHLARVCLEVGRTLTPFQEVELRPSLREVSAAWAAAERDWHPAMAAPNSARSSELVQAGIDAAQTWKTITRRGPRWATGAEVAASHDLGDLLEISAQHHRRASLLAHDYAAASGRLLAAGTVTIPAKLAQQMTGLPAVTRRVPLTAEYLAASGFGSSRVNVAAETARVALDTVLLHSPAATAARARLPLQMAAPDLDAAIRERLDTLARSRSNRAATAAKTSSPRRRPDPPNRPNEPRPGPQQR